MALVVCRSGKFMEVVYECLELGRQISSVKNNCHGILRNTGTKKDFQICALVSLGSKTSARRDIHGNHHFCTRLWRTAKCLRALALANNRLKPKPLSASFLSLQVCLCVHAL